MSSGRRVPPDKWRPERIEKVEQVFDYLAGHPDGATGDEMAAWLEVSKSTIQRVVHDLRIVLGGTDSITVTCEALGLPTEPHTYRLVGNLEDATGWLSARILEQEVRLETIEYSTASLVTGSDGRTLEGKKARKIHRTLKYLREELAEIGSDDSLF